MIEEKKARLRRHFGNRPIVWVPFWGISKLRCRGGAFPGEIPGELIDYDKWYARMLSPATFDQLAELGFNLAVLHFSIGGTPEHEAQEHEDFRQAAALCREGGVTASLRKRTDGGEFIQLLDYRCPEETRSVVVRFGRERAGVYRPLDGAEKKFRSAVLEIPDFRLYGMITFEKK